MSGTKPADLASLVRPGAVAIIGASADRPASAASPPPIAYMLRAGFQGAILPVNPNRAEVQGLASYPSVAALPQVPDVAVVAVPGPAALRAVEELAERGTRFAVMFTAGYAEVGEVAAQDALVAAARRHGMRLLGPNCLGLFNAAAGFYPIFTASLEGGLPLPGRIGIASQSGAYGTLLFAACRARGIGTGMLITTGNEADLSVADAIGWMTRDDGLDVIMAYVEGVQDGPAFADALAEARRARKPVILMKVGRSAVGSAAAQSHTASIAGNDAIFSAVLPSHGAIRARSTEELIDIAYAATRRIYRCRTLSGSSPSRAEPAC